MLQSAGPATPMPGEPQIESYNVAREGRDPKNRLRITIPLVEGAQYLIDEISVEGNELFTDEGVGTQIINNDEE